jgi:hypothetical protein
MSFDEVLYGSTADLKRAMRLGLLRANTGRQYSNAAANVLQVIKIRIKEPTVYKVARVSWVRAVK